MRIRDVFTAVQEAASSIWQRTPAPVKTVLSTIGNVAKGVFQSMCAAVSSFRACMCDRVITPLCQTCCSQRVAVVVNRIFRRAPASASQANSDSVSALARPKLNREATINLKNIQGAFAVLRTDSNIVDDDKTIEMANQVVAAAENIVNTVNGSEEPVDGETPEQVAQRVALIRHATGIASLTARDDTDVSSEEKNQLKIDLEGVIDIACLFAEPVSRGIESATSNDSSRGVLRSSKPIRKRDALLMQEAARFVNSPHK